MLARTRGTGCTLRAKIGSFSDEIVRSLHSVKTRENGSLEAILLWERQGNITLDVQLEPNKFYEAFAEIKREKNYVLMSKQKEKA
jgi:hypothetical protein